MTDPHELNRYRRIAQVAHQALADYAAAAPASDMLKTFPAGCCGVAAELVGRYLREAGEPALYVNGTRGSGDDFQSHAWVEVGPVIIDVTAGQFSEIRSRFIVTTSRIWHAQWEAYDEPRPPIVSADQWPAYPFMAWGALAKALAQQVHPLHDQQEIHPAAPAAPPA